MIKSKIDYMDEAAELSLVNIKNRKEITKKFVDYFVKNNFKRIQFVGSGSSYNIAKNASYFVQKVLNIPVSVNWAFTFLNYDIDYVEDDTLVILCSQGGFSTNTVGAARKLTQRSKKCIAFCKFTDTPLKDEVKLLIDYHFTAGDLSQTKGFVMSSLFIMLCGLEAAYATKKIDDEQYAKYVEELTLAAKKLPEVKKVSEDFYAKNDELLKSIDRLMVIGCGPNYGIAMEGALKYEETYGSHADPFEMEDLIHGKLCEVTKNSTIFFTDSASSATHERLVEIYNVLFDICDRIIILTDSDDIKGKYVLKINDDKISEEVAVIYQAVPFQYFTYKTCQDTMVEAHSRERVRCTKKLATKYPGVKF